MWVFGYGSLIWNPGFPVAERVIARLEGYARSFCMRSIHHRGTEDDPGLVLALDTAPERSCLGVGFRIPEGAEGETLKTLRERELVSSAYIEREVPLALSDGRTVRAVTYIVDRAHWQYVADLGAEEQARIIAGATGGRGPNDEYLFNTVSHLSELGIEDAALSALAERVSNISGQKA